jgi:hypothetical protein
MAQGKLREIQINEQNEETLQCSICGEWKVLSKFSSNGKYKNGTIRYHSACKKCNNKIERGEHGKEYIKRTAEINDSGQEILFCPKCEAWKILDCFSVRGIYEDGSTQYRIECKECMSKKAKNWKKDNFEKAIITHKHWRKNNPEKIKGYGRKYYKNNSTKICDYSRKWAKNNPTKVKIIKKKSDKKYRITHAEQLKEADRRRRNENPEKIQEYRNNQKIDRKLHPEKWRIINLKHHNARRGYGYESINAPVLDYVFHHLGTLPNGNHNSNIGVFVPRDLNPSDHAIFSSIGNHGYGMIYRNTEIYKWYKETYPKDIKTIEFLRQVVEATIERIANGWENAIGWDEWIKNKQDVKYMNRLLNNKGCDIEWYTKEVNAKSMN